MNKIFVPSAKHTGPDIKCDRCGKPIKEGDKIVRHCAYLTACHYKCEYSGTFEIKGNDF